MISEDRLQKAITYLAETDELASELKTDVDRKDYAIKMTEAAIVVHSEGAMELRKATAKDSDAYKQAVDNYLNAVNRYNDVNNKRKTELLITEIWRSLNANRRLGNI